MELTYTLDAGLFAGTSIVVFETLYHDGVEIAAHADINDEAQTVTINPKGGLLIQKTSEDGALEGFTFLVEGEGYSETFTTDGAGKIYIEDLSPGEYTITEQENDLTARYEIPRGADGGSHRRSGGDRGVLQCPAERQNYRPQDRGGAGSLGGRHLRAVRCGSH